MGRAAGVAAAAPAGSSSGEGEASGGAAAVPTAAGQQAGAAGPFNAPCTETEMHAAVHALNVGRAAGPGGLCAELIKGARLEVPAERGRTLYVYLLLGELRTLFNQAFVQRQVPGAWCSAHITAVHKKGDAADPDNYRGIAVGGAMGKLYSMLLTARLDAYAEGQGLRAQGQSGFRRGRSTSDSMFVLKHCIDKCRAGLARGAGGLTARRLFVCFVDFRKAYDSVRRDLLMQCMADSGVGGHMLAALLAMYWHAPMRTKVGQRLGAEFTSTRGVKQGDPLSPLLFGIFIDRIEKWLAESCPQCGVRVDQFAAMLQALLFADDLALLAYSPDELQQLLAALRAFCEQYGLEVNVEKSFVVVFGNSAYSEERTFWYDQAAGLAIPRRGH